MGSSAGSRTRAWVFIAYPEELPQNFVSLLNSLNIEIAVSPLHHLDPDNISPEEQRKDHRHVALYYDSVKTLDQVTSDLESIFITHAGWCRPVMIRSMKAMLRYFIHLDQPEKQQFPGKWNEIITLSGFELENYLVPTSSEKGMFLEQMSKYIQDNNVTEFSEFYYFARDKYYDSWFYLLNNGCSNLIKIIIDSERHKNKVNKEYAKLEKRFDSCSQALRTVTDEVFELSDKLKDREARFAECAKELSDTQAKLSKYVLKYGEVV